METFVTRRLVKVYDTGTELFHDAADLFISEGTKAITEHGKFSVALSGGSTPVPLYSLLSSAEYRSKIDWKLIHFFWADERCVPKDHPASNFKLAYDLLLSKLPVPVKNFHRIHGELEAASAASLYESDLTDFFGKSSFPKFDLVFLGVGADGHTASLFPGIDPTDGTSRKVIYIYVKQMNSFRVTLTLPVLNNSGTVAFLVTGNSKATVLRKILENNDPDCPAARVNPRRGRSIWFIDQEAASLLTSEQYSKY